MNELVPSPVQSATTEYVIVGDDPHSLSPTQSATTNIMIALVGTAIAAGIGWAIHRSDLQPNRRMRRNWWKKGPKKPPRRIYVAGTEAAQSRLLKDAQGFKRLDLVPMQQRIEWWNEVLGDAYYRGEIAEATYNAWKDKLPV